MAQTKEARIIQLYELMAQHTNPVCKHECTIPLSCCDAMYCDLAEQYAKEEFSITLQPTGHEKLKFMGPGGCTVPPYLRPLCAIHVCSVEKMPEEWQRKYFALRSKISKLSLTQIKQEKGL